MTNPYTHGKIDQSAIGRKNDYLYRISLKALIKNVSGEILVVKESGRSWWDLPGGGMDHGEAIKSALARELSEEVGLTGDFEYQIIEVDNPSHLVHAHVLQVRLIFQVFPADFSFSVGEDADDVKFLDPAGFETSEMQTERNIYDYSQKTISQK